MASFLQSSASVEVLARAGSIRHHSDNNERLDGMHMKPSQQVVRFSTGKISFPGHVEENRTGAAQPSSSHPQHKNAANTNMRERDNAPIVHSTRHDIRLLEGRLHDPHFLAIAPSRHELEKTSPSASSTTSTSARRKELSSPPRSTPSPTSSAARRTHSPSHSPSPVSQHRLQAENERLTTIVNDLRREMNQLQLEMADAHAVAEKSRENANAVEQCQQLSQQVALLQGELASAESRYEVLLKTDEKIRLQLERALHAMHQEHQHELERRLREQEEAHGLEKLRQVRLELSRMRTRIELSTSAVGTVPGTAAYYEMDKKALEILKIEVEKRDQEIDILNRLLQEHQTHCNSVASTSSASSLAQAAGEPVPRDSSSRKVLISATDILAAVEHSSSWMPTFAVSAQEQQFIDALHLQQEMLQRMQRRLSSEGAAHAEALEAAREQVRLEQQRSTRILQNRNSQARSPSSSPDRQQQISGQNLLSLEAVKAWIPTILDFKVPTDLEATVAGLLPHIAQDRALSERCATLPSILKGASTRMQACQTALASLLALLEENRQQMTAQLAFKQEETSSLTHSPCRQCLETRSALQLSEKNLVYLQKQYHELQQQQNAQAQQSLVTDYWRRQHERLEDVLSQTTQLWVMRSEEQKMLEHLVGEVDVLVKRCGEATPPQLSSLSSLSQSLLSVKEALERYRWSSAQHAAERGSGGDDPTQAVVNVLRQELKSQREESSSMLERAEEAMLTASSQCRKLEDELTFRQQERDEAQRLAQSCSQALQERGQDETQRIHERALWREKEASHAWQIQELQVLVHVLQVQLNEFVGNGNDNSNGNSNAYANDGSKSATSASAHSSFIAGSNNVSSLLSESSFCVEDRSVSPLDKDKDWAEKEKEKEREKDGQLSRDVSYRSDTSDTMKMHTSLQAAPSKHAASPQPSKHV